MSNLLLQGIFAIIIFLTILKNSFELKIAVEPLLRLNEISLSLDMVIMYPPYIEQINTVYSLPHTFSLVVFGL